MPERLLKCAGMTAQVRPEQVLKSRRNGAQVRPENAVEGVLGALVGSEVEDSATSEVWTVADDEAVCRLHRVAEEASKDPAKPCRWFTEMPEFA